MQRLSLGFARTIPAVLGYTTPVKALGSGMAAGVDPFELRLVNVSVDLRGRDVHMT